MTIFVKAHDYTPDFSDSTIYLPNELLVEIFSHLDWNSFCNASLVCRQWRELIKHDSKLLTQAVRSLETRLKSIESEFINGPTLFLSNLLGNSGFSPLRIQVVFNLCARLRQIHTFEILMNLPIHYDPTFNASMLDHFTRQTLNTSKIGCFLSSWSRNEVSIALPDKNLGPLHIGLLPNEVPYLIVSTVNSVTLFVFDSPQPKCFDVTEGIIKNKKYNKELNFDFETYLSNVMRNEIPELRLSHRRFSRAKCPPPNISRL